MTLDEVELRIFEHYQFFAKEAPGVKVQEVGDLAALWALADSMYAES